MQESPFRGDTVDSSEAEARARGVGATVVFKGTVLNLMGQGIPLVVALLCFPVIAGGLGPERFGVLVLSWTVVGYAGAFDLGLGRAAARFIAAALARGATGEVPSILGTALLAESLLGIVAGVAIAAFAPLLVLHVFALPADLEGEGLATLQLIALAVPIVLLSNSLRGSLFAAQRFDLVNAVMVLASSSMYLLSTIGVLAGWRLPVIVASLVASKTLALATLWILARRHCPGLRAGGLSTDRRAFHDLIRFGSWLTVSSMMLPVMKQAERFFIPALLSVGALAFYVVPFEAVSRAAILPISMALALFPAFSRLDRCDGPSLTDLVIRPSRYLLLIMTPAFALPALFADELLTVWMGRAFAAEAAPPLRLLAAAFYVSGFAHILKAAVQGLGRPDLKAKLDLVITGLFLSLLFVLIPRFGLEGAATAKLVMALADLTGLLVLASYVAPQALKVGRVLGLLLPGLTISAAFVLVAAAATTWWRGSAAAYLMFVILAAVYVCAFWKWVADDKDRRAAERVWDWVGRTRRGGVLSPVDVRERP
jgi:O-antigen/teichoic acid export membrane protein